MNFIKMSKWFTNLTLSLLIALPGFAFEESDIQMQADKVDFDYQKGISYFEGNARFEYKGSKVVSDKAQIATADRIVKAEGNVVIVDDSGAYIADSLDYNFTEKQGELINGLTMDGPWILKGDKITQISKDEIRLDHGSFYLCPHYQIKAKEITVFPGKKLVARNVIFFIGAIPIFYLPYFSRSLDKQWGYRLNIAHNDKFGLQILTQFHTSFENGIDATLHADYYQKRGIGVGVDAKKTYDRGRFKSYSYFINDDEFEPNRSSEEAGELTRYALSLEHYHKFENDWNSSLDLNIHSDEDFYDDFFTDRFDEDIQKDNRYRLSSSNERYSLGLNVRVRLNDFYNVLERMPQLHFDWHSMEVGENTNIFYSSSNQAVNLQQKFDDEDEDKDEIDLFRFNSSHRLEYSKKFWGWLSVSPNVVMEGTWYSKTKRIETEDV